MIVDWQKIVPHVAICGMPGPFRDALVDIRHARARLEMIRSERVSGMLAGPIHSVPARMHEDDRMRAADEFDFPVQVVEIATHARVCPIGVDLVVRQRFHGNRTAPSPTALGDGEDHALVVVLVARARNAFVRVVAWMEEVVDQEPVRFGLHGCVVDKGLRTSLRSVFPVVVTVPIPIGVEPCEVVGLGLEPSLLRYEGSVALGQRAVGIWRGWLSTERHPLTWHGRLSFSIDANPQRGRDALQSGGQERFAFSARRGVQHGIRQVRLSVGHREQPPFNAPWCFVAQLDLLVTLIPERLRDPPLVNAADVKGRRTALERHRSRAAGQLGPSARSPYLHH